MKKLYEKEGRGILRLLTGIASALIMLTAAACSKADATATTMRLLAREGTIHLFSNGKEKTVTDDLKLESGDTLSTEASSMVSVSLDDFKLVTMDENSSADFKQEGKALSLYLSEGTLFLQVDQKLAEDESLDVSTSNTICGIRGTSVVFTTRTPNGNHGIYVTSGEVHIVATNPQTGEQKEIIIDAGECAEVWLYDDPDRDTVEFEKREFSPESLPSFAIEAILADPESLSQVMADTGWTEEQLNTAKEIAKENEANGVGFGSPDADSGSGNDDDDDGDGNGAAPGTPGNGTDPLSPQDPDAAGGQDEKPNDNDDGDNNGGNDGDNGDGNDGTADGNPANDGGNGQNNGQNIIPTTNEQQPEEGTLEAEALKLKNKYPMSENGRIILDGELEFDPVLYARLYPSIVSTLGTDDPYILLYHYLQDGKTLGLSPNQAAYDAYLAQKEQDHQMTPEEWAEFDAQQQAAAEEAYRKQQEEEARLAAEKEADEWRQTNGNEENEVDDDDDDDDDDSSVTIRLICTRTTLRYSISDQLQTEIYAEISGTSEVPTWGVETAGILSYSAEGNMVSVEIDAVITETTSHTVSCSAGGVTESITITVSP